MRGALSSNNFCRLLGSSLTRQHLRVCITEVAAQTGPKRYVSAWLWPLGRHAAVKGTGMANTSMSTPSPLPSLREKHLRLTGASLEAELLQGGQAA